MNGSDKQTNLIEIAQKKVQLVLLNFKELNLFTWEKNRGKTLERKKLSDHYSRVISFEFAVTCLY